MRNRPNLIVLHHNGKPGRTIDDIRRTHEGWGWRDVGYHYVTLESGIVQRGRPESRAGAHARGINHRSIGICLIGNYDVDPHVPDAQWTSALVKVAELQEAYGIPCMNVIGHRDVNTLGLPAKYHTRKLCPGRYFDMMEFRRELPAWRGEHA